MTLDKDIRKTVEIVDSNGKTGRKGGKGDCSSKGDGSMEGLKDSRD